MESPGLAPPQTLSFRDDFALAVEKTDSPRVVNFIRGLNDLQRENKGSLNKLGLAKKMSHTKVRTHSVMPKKARVIVAEALLTSIYLT